MKDISLSHSSLQILQSCPLRYLMSRVEGRERLGQTRGRRRGAASSDALEHRDPGKIHDAYDKHLMDAVKQSLVDDLLIERQILEALYRRHVEYFGDDDMREVAFDYEIDGAPGYRNRGRIDGVNTHEENGVIVVQLEEDKLMQMWGRADENALPLNGQVLRYLGAAEKLFDHADVIQLQYRVTRYPGAYRKVDESPKAYADRVCEGLAKKKPADLFAVNLIELSDPAVRASVDRYYADLTTYALEEQRRRELGQWPGAYGDACKAYGGCEFLPACKQEPNFEELFTHRSHGGETK